jgi:hypothetical protein
MSEQEETECGVCGRVGIPFAECGICHGKAPVQQRHYTLSEERSGRTPETDRYSRTGAVGPKIINLPGSGQVGT